MLEERNIKQCWSLDNYLIGQIVVRCQCDCYCISSDVYDAYVHLRAEKQIQSVLLVMYFLSSVRTYYCIHNGRQACVWKLHHIFGVWFLTDCVLSSATSFQFVIAFFVQTGHVASRVLTAVTKNSHLLRFEKFFFMVNIPIANNNANKFTLW